MRKIIVLAFVLFVAVFTVAAMPSYETKDNYYTVPSVNVSSSNTDSSYSTKTYTPSSIQPPAGFIKVHAKSYDKTGVVIINPDAIAMIVPLDNGEVTLYLSYGVGTSGRVGDTELSSITISETYDELVSLIENARKSVANQ